MLYGNCAKDTQSYRRQDQLWSAAAVLPLYTVTVGTGKVGQPLLRKTHAAREGLGKDAC
jgi:hypothetical protein